MKLNFETDGAKGWNAFGVFLAALIVFLAQITLVIVGLAVTVWNLQIMWRGEADFWNFVYMGLGVLVLMLGRGKA